MSTSGSSLRLSGLAADRHMTLMAVGAAVVTAVVLAALAPAHAAWLLIAAALLGCALLAPVAGLALLPWAAAFGATFTLSLHGLNMTPLDVLVAGLVLSALRPLLQARRAIAESGARGWIAAAQRELGAAWRTRRGAVVLFAGLAAYLGVVGLSLAVATDRVATIKEIIKWGEVLAVVAAGAALLRRPGEVRVVVWAMVGAGLAEALIGYVQWAISANAAQLAEGGRVFGTFGQPNPYAGYLNLSLPLALALVFFGRDARERLLAAGSAVLLLGAEALSASRGGLIGLAAALVVIAAVGLRRERIAAALVAVGVLVAALALFTTLIPARLTHLVLHPLRLDNISPNAAVTSANFSTMQRLAYWIAGLRMFAAHPILGVGAGNYNAAYARYATNLADWPEPLGHAHNYYINAAAETGLLGLAAFVVFAAGVVLVAWRASHLAAGRVRGTRRIRGVGQRDGERGEPKGVRRTRKREEIHHRGNGGESRELDAREQTLTAGKRDRQDQARVASGTVVEGAMETRVPVRALAIGLFAVVVALLAHNLTDDLFVHGMDVEFALVVACLLSLAYRRSSGAAA